jgi:DNA-3-methyladenine glycosylase
MRVARELVGCALVTDPGGPLEVVALIVEVEAYLGEADPASHAHRGPTPRAAIMFGPPGQLYVYLSYGVHHCANLVTEVEGTAGAVLLRAASIEAGEDVVRRRRAAVGSRRGEPSLEAPLVGLLRGPGNLCRGLGLTLADNHLDTTSAGSRVEVWSALGRPPIEALTRVGISRASDRLLRFAWKGHPAVSGRRSSA